MTNPKACHRGTLHLLGPSKSWRVTFQHIGLPFHAKLSPGTKQLQMRQQILLCWEERGMWWGREGKCCFPLTFLPTVVVLWGEHPYIGTPVHPWTEKGWEWKLRLSKTKADHTDSPQKEHVSTYRCVYSIYIFKITILPWYCNRLCYQLVYRLSTDSVCLKVKICRTYYSCTLPSSSQDLTRPPNLCFPSSCYLIETEKIKMKYT